MRDEEAIATALIAEPPAAVLPAARPAGIPAQARAPRPEGRPPVFAALDLGTNNCRLLVAKPHGSSLQVIDAFSRIVRLGEGLEATGRLSQAAMDRTIAALRICAGKIRSHRPRAARIVATEACRRAANGGAFLHRVQRETGLAIEVISPGEEALLALGGCAALLDPDVRHALMFDIGGGSTEIMFLEVPPRGAMTPPMVRGWISVPAGVVSLAERFADAACTYEGYQAMRGAVAGQLAQFDRAHGISSAVAEGGVQMLGSSGTVTTLAGIHLGLPRYDRSRVDGCSLTVREIRAVSGAVVEMDQSARLAHPCIGRARADLVVAGCAILDAICALWPVETLRIADRGVREGILLGLMGNPAPRRLNAAAE